MAPQPLLTFTAGIMLLTYFPTAAHRPEPTTDTLDDWAEQDFKIKRQVQPASPGVDNNLQALQNRFAYLNNTTGVGPKDAGAHNETAQHGRGFLSSLYETASSMALDAASMAADAVKGFVSGVSAGIGGDDSTTEAEETSDATTETPPE